MWFKKISSKNIENFWSKNIFENFQKKYFWKNQKFRKSLRFFIWKKNRRKFFHIKNLKDFRKFWFFQKYFFGKFPKIFFDQTFSIFFDEIFLKPHLLIQKDTVKLISNKLKPFKPSDWTFLKNVSFFLQKRLIFYPIRDQVRRSSV